MPAPDRLELDMVRRPKVADPAAGGRPAARGGDVDLQPGLLADLAPEGLDGQLPLVNVTSRGQPQAEAAVEQEECASVPDDVARGDDMVVEPRGAPRRGLPPLLGARFPRSHQAAARRAQPAMKSRPPSGVMAPRRVRPVRLKA